MWEPLEAGRGQETGSLLASPGGSSPAHTLTLFSSVGPIEASDLQDCKRINGCCLKPPVCRPVTAAAGNAGLGGHDKDLGFHSEGDGALQGFKQRSDTVFGTLERVLGMSCVEKRPWVERVPARLGERRELVRRLRQ